MVIDSLSHTNLYAELNPRFKKAIEYINSIDLKNIAEGRYEIDGDNIYMSVVGNASLRSVADAYLEAHDKYIDIQIIISGIECFGWADREQCKNIRTEMNLSNDIMFFNDKPSTYFSLGESQMVIFFPKDAHAPLIGTGTVKKCIIKVLA